MILQKVQCTRCREHLRSGPAPFEFAPAPKRLCCGNCSAPIDASAFPFRFAYYFRYTLRLWIVGAALFTAYGMWKLDEPFDLAKLASGTLFLGFVLGIVPSLVLAAPVGFVVDRIGHALGVDRPRPDRMRRATDRPRLAIVRDDEPARERQYERERERRAA